MMRDVPDMLFLPPFCLLFPLIKQISGGRVHRPVLSMSLSDCEDGFVSKREEKEVWPIDLIKLHFPPVWPRR